MKNLKVTITALAALFVSQSTFAKAPAADERLTGIMECELKADREMTLEYSAYRGSGRLRAIKNGQTVMSRDIFLLEGMRCSAYSGTCHTVITAPLRVGNELKFFVDQDGEVYNFPDIFNLKVNEDTIEVLDTEEFDSALHLAVGYEGAPAPLDKRGKLDMVCAGTLHRANN